MEKIPFRHEEAPESEAVLASRRQEEIINQEIEDQYEAVRQLGNLDSSILNSDWEAGSLIGEGLGFQEGVPSPEGLQTDDKVFREALSEIAGNNIEQMANGNMVLKNSNGKFYELDPDGLGNLMDLARQYREGEITDYKKSVEDEIIKYGQEVSAQDLPEVLKRSN